jgi:hypothetical protein
VQLEQLVHRKIGLDVKDAQALLIDAITATGQSPSLHPPPPPTPSCVVHKLHTIHSCRKYPLLHL